MSTQREHASHAGLLPRLLLRLNLHGKRKLIAAVVAVCVLFLLVLPYYRDGGYNASMVRSIASKDDPGPGVKKPTVKSAKGAASTLLRSQLNEARRKVTSLQQALSSCNASAATTTKEVAGATGFETVVNSVVAASASPAALGDKLTRLQYELFCAARRKAYKGRVIPKVVMFPVLAYYHYGSYRIETPWKTAFTRRSFLETRHFQHTTYVVSKQNKAAWLPFGRLCPDTQMFNHIPGATVVTNKVTTARTLKRYEKSSRDGFAMDRFAPRTYDLTDPEDCTAFISAAREAHDSGNPDEVEFIVKSGGSDNNKGVMAVSNSDLNQWLVHNKKSGKCFINKKDLAQRYISRPLLTNGHKTDFRAFFLVASTKPFLAFFFPQLMARRSSQMYKATGKGKSALTAVASDKKIKRDPRLLSRYQWNNVQFQKYLNENELVSDPNWVNNVMVPQLTAMASRLLHSALPDLKIGRGHFELFGMDVLLDSKLKPWFIENNFSPQVSLVGQSPWKQQVNYKITQQTLDVVHAILEYHHAHPGKEITLERLQKTGILQHVYAEPVAKQTGDGPIQWFHERFPEHDEHYRRTKVSAASSASASAADQDEE